MNNNNSNMTTTSSAKTLYEFLKEHPAVSGPEGSNFTHTRIGNGQDIKTGSYCILPHDLPTFYRLYCNEVFKFKRAEYLTEKQLKNGPPIAVDLDFKYEYSICEHQYGEGHITDIIELYLSVIKDFLQIDEGSTITTFVMEKAHVNRVEDNNYTKDGIHLIFGVQMDHTMQQMLRQNILEKIPQVCDLPLINEWDQVLDAGISVGHTGWQLYGSKKPNHEAYKLTKVYVATMDDSGEFEVVEQDEEFDVVSNFSQLSVQYTEHPKFEINVGFLATYNEQLIAIQRKSRPHTSSGDCDCDLQSITANNYADCIHEITCLEELTLATEAVLKTMNSSVREIHDYVQILPAQYYQPGSHVISRKVAFALKHTDERLFLSWVMLRSKADDFDYGDILNLHKEWIKTSKRSNGITKKSIIYWAKQDAYDAYVEVKKNTLNSFLEKSCICVNDYDLAMVLYQMFKEKYICSSITHKTWYVFKEHRWVIDRGQTLRKAISQDMWPVYTAYQEKCRLEVAKLHELMDEETNEKATQIKAVMKNTSNILQRCKQSGDKDHIMKEALELFYDDNFIKNMDSNKYLLCFTNGVVDFDAENEYSGKIIFRDGFPQDYITKTTGIPYIPAQAIDKSIETQIIQFMGELFPDPELRTYMLNHLASTFIGTNLNQTFNIYVGCGSNGKSLLTDLMTHTLGEYSGTVPITLVTEKRTSIGGVSPELIQLKGLRYAVMQEPSKNMRINEGMMKQLSAGDPLQGRALYCDSETFEPQFKLVVCTNSLFDFNSNDDGTWRRIRKCDFESRFLDAEDFESAEKDGKTFIKDKSLKDKMPSWAPVFASMLVSRAYLTKGNVAECARIVNSSKQYRHSQDPFSAFIVDKIVICDKTSMPLTEMELKTVFKEWLRDTYPGYKAKLPELYDLITKKFGKQEAKGWVGIRLNEHMTEGEGDGDM
jgi:P4 family phage/plasmid primase-like protien